MGRLKALFLKDVRLSLSWFLTNVGIILLFNGIALYNAIKGNDIALLFLGMMVVGLLIWSVFAGIATYFSERDGRLYEFINTLPVSRHTVLVSKALWLCLQALIYVALFVAGVILVVKLGKLNIVEGPMSFQLGLMGTLNFYLRITTMLLVGLFSAALVKDIPFKWLMAVIMLFVIVWILGWVDTLINPNIRNLSLESADRLLKVQTLAEGLKFAGAWLLVGLGGLWIERRGY
ncbi:MAG: hypothetical protein GXO29_03435 [Thermotogae bacterium]|nr:hypothetical protein [Thermotogota bacterium]